MTAWDDISFEWARGPFRLSLPDSLLVMARIAELEAENAELKRWGGCQPGCMCTRHITRMVTTAEARELAGSVVSDVENPEAL